MTVSYRRQIERILNRWSAREHLEKAGRYPAGSPGGKGGQFAPSGVTGGGSAFHSKYPGMTKPTAKPASGGHFSALMAGKDFKPVRQITNAVKHPAADDKGNPVSINFPSKPSHSETWADKTRTATFVPGGKTPEKLNGVAMKSWTDAPRTADQWQRVEGQNPRLDHDHPFEETRGKTIGAGVIIREPDGRVWLTKPTNEFGGYKNTFPKGTVEHGLSMQASAIKEAYEETGLKVKIVGVLGDYERSTSKARFYIAERVGGTPKDMGWESQAMRLAAPKDLNKLLNAKVDRGIWADFQEEHVHKAAGAKRGHFNDKQARWPAGTPLGGQWMAVGADGVVKPPKIAGGHEGKNAAYQKKADALYAAAQANNKEQLVKSAIDLATKTKEHSAAGKKSSHVTWNAQLSQYATKLMNDALAAPKAEAVVTRLSGPIDLSTLTYSTPKPGGSNPGAIYSDGKDKLLVKGNAQKEHGNVTAAQSDDRAKNEVLASKLLHAAGVGAPEMKLVKLNGKYGGGLGVASKMVTNTEKFNPTNPSHLFLARGDFAVHAWMANYDVLGQGYDNTVFKDGKAINIDPGGALLFRAQGLPKEEFSKNPKEWFSMRNTTPEQKAVFGKMDDAALKESAKKLATITDDVIHNLVKTHGPGDDAAKAKLAETLIARRDKILEYAGLKTDDVKVGDSTVKQAEPVDPPKPPRLKDVVKAPANTHLPMAAPTFTSGLKSDEYYTDLVKTAASFHKEGDVDGLKGMIKSSHGTTWGGKTVNSKKLVEYHSALLADLEKKQAGQIDAVTHGLATVKDSKGKEWRADKGVINPVAPASKNPLPPPPDFSAQKLGAENTNAKTINKKVDAIREAYMNGNAADILKMGFGTNNYEKKIVKLANATLAALGSSHQVLLSQKPYSHLALTQSTAQGTAPKASSKEAPAPVGQSWIKLRSGEKVIEDGESFGVKWAKIEVPAKGFDPTAFGNPPDFFQNGSQGPTGKWKSSKESVNQANNDAVAAIKEAAVNKGTPAKLEALKLPIVGDGGKVTMVPVAQHKAAGVKEYHTQVVAELKAQLLPTYKSVQQGSFSESYSAAAKTISDAYRTKSYEGFKAHTKKAADYLVLSDDAGANIPVPQAGQFKETGPSHKAYSQFRTASQAAFSAMTDSEKSAAKAYTGSSYDKWNEALRTGATDSAAYKNAQTMVNAFAKAAKEIPEGSVIWRGIDVGASTYKSVVGGLIQDGSFNSASYGASPAFSGKPTWLKIHVPKGVKGVDATIFSNFASQEREIIIQNNVRYLVLKVEKHDNYKTTDGKTWGPKTIVDVIALPH